MKEKESKYKIPYSNIDLIKDLWKFLKPYKSKFWLGTFLRLTSDLVWLYPAYALAKIVNLLTNKTNENILNEFFIILGLFFISAIYHYVARILSKFFMNQLAEKVSIDQQVKTINHIFNLDLSWHEKENSGNKVKRIQKGGEGINDIFRLWNDYIIQTVVYVVGMFFVIIAFDVLIAVIILFFIISFLFISNALIKKASEAANIVNIAEEEVSGLIFESINNIRSVKVLGMKQYLSKIINKNFVFLFDKIKDRVYYVQRRNLIINAYAQIFRFVPLVIIGIGIYNGKYEVGFFILFYDYFGRIWEAIAQLSNSVDQIIISRYGIYRMKILLDEPIKIDEEENKKLFPQNWKKISIQNLSFNYGNEIALNNISFDITRGQKIGIVGLSGAGKSTIFKLLLKEHENYTGKILIDDVALKDIGKTDYLKHAATVLQETELFNFSLKQNIEIVSEKISKDRLKHALEVSHVAEFIDKMPNGVDTLIGEKGVKLSGGEKQRVGIARAVYKQPNIFFLDEATSHLDVESEEKIKDSLHQFFNDVTAVVIAHRLSTIKEMDRILVFENGKIIESGSFSELTKKKGRFFELWEKQKF